ncbi:YgcG family protein [Comamonadaceae bacterium OH2545_COT-014]|nr:YgcG family protein [Comamonadaceae bacterium OH2545_COT-014]
MHTAHAPALSPRRWLACWHRLLFLWLTCLACLSPAWAQPLQAVPALTARVIDTTGTLTAEQATALEAKLAALEEEKGAQVVVLMVPTTAPEDIAAYANRVGNAWKIGRRDVGDGAILLVALQDRRMRIEVAKTLEGAIPDIAAKRIIEQAMAPRFRQGDIAGGLDAAVDQMAARIRGEALPAVQSPATRGGASSGLTGLGLFEALIFLAFAASALSAMARGIFGRKLGSLLAGGGVALLAFVLTASLLIAIGAGLFALVLSLLSGALATVPRSGRSGVHFPPPGGGWGSGGGSWGGGGGFGGGGFGSGGGGDFGGGGASGSW